MAVQPHTVSLIVRDMAASLAFYRLIGLEIPADQDAELHVEVSTPAGYAFGFDAEPMVREVDPHYPAWQGTNEQRVGLEFQCDSVSEVNETYTRLTTAGYPSYKEPWDAPWGQRFARVKDPDGNVVSFFAQL